ncbi:hypothetical protein LRS73_20785 [Methylobacterium currus]|uniref:hypothetical protein n=1 Tax=Methylobacterium currus TaxID=2051553 RepID=UPI001E4E654E|nr:hypothetical protein [Methylobacterium currus]UHC14951.1 hypothetical protein LRS73_20785 [Methylobacterium currus]
MQTFVPAGPGVRSARRSGPAESSTISAGLGRAAHGDEIPAPPRPGSCEAFAVDFRAAAAMGCRLAFLPGRLIGAAMDAVDAALRDVIIEPASPVSLIPPRLRTGPFEGAG